MAKPVHFNSSILPFLDEYNNEYETPEKQETSNDEEPKMIMEDMDTQTSTALVQRDEYDPDSIANKGCKCFWLFAVFFVKFNKNTLHGLLARCTCI